MKKYRRGKKGRKSRSGYRRKKYGKKWSKSKKQRRVSTVLKTIRPKGVSRRTSMKSETYWIDYTRAAGVNIAAYTKPVRRVPIFKVNGKDAGLQSYFPLPQIQSGNGPVYINFNGSFGTGPIKGTQIVLKYIDLRFTIEHKVQQLSVFPTESINDALRLIIVKPRQNNSFVDADLFETGAGNIFRQFNFEIDRKKWKILYDKIWPVSLGNTFNVLAAGAGWNQTPPATPPKFFRFILPFKTMLTLEQDVTTGLPVQPTFQDDIWVYCISRNDTEATDPLQGTDWKVTGIGARWYYKDP